jgi:single-strand DNA-binding protein
MNLNTVFIAGNLTRDPELRFTPKGTAVCKFAVAVNREWKAEGGEKKKETTFIDVDAFGQQAERIGQFFTKGKSIFIAGRLKMDNWDDKATGQKRSKLGVILENFQFVGPKEEGEAAPAPRATQASAPAPQADSETSDVPF